MAFEKIPYTAYKIENLVTTEKIGFSNIPEQMRFVSMEKGFQINLIFIGRRGLGTSTLVNSIFAAPLIDKNRGNGLTTTKNEIFENEIKLSTVISTYHGCDSNVVIDYINEKNLNYFENERGLNGEFVDRRLYACIYLLPLDEINKEEIDFMKNVSSHCNFIPVIPKSDIFTADELISFRHKMLEILKVNEINLFWPGLSHEIDPEVIEDTQIIVKKYPLAIVASESVYEHKGEVVRGRKYRWGFIDVENEEISDFYNLRKLLIHTFLDDLIEQMEINFYDIFRRRCLKNEELIARLDNSLMVKLKKEVEKVCEERKSKEKMVVDEKINAIGDEFLNSGSVIVDEE